MNSLDKFRENEENNPSQMAGVLSDKAILQSKINYQISNYRMRVLSAQEEIADLTRCISFNSHEYLMLSEWRSRISVLLEEIKFCKNQIYAYENNNNKAKIIPDRLL